MAILLGFSLVYVLVKNQLVNVMNEKLHFLYKEKIEADIQNIYREFESYSAIIDSRINRLKTLTERQETNIKAWEEISGEIKKTKTGKEFLKYMETRNDQTYLTADDLENVKKQITKELKTYLSMKLQLDHEKTPVAKTPEAKPSLNISRIKPPLDITQNQQEELNAAELIVDDLVTDQFYRPKPSVDLKPSSSPTRIPQKDNTITENKFITTLASIGKSLTPFLLSSDSSSVSTSRNPEYKKQADFNELLRKEPGIKQARQSSLKPEKSEPPEVPPRPLQNSNMVTEETVSIRTSLAPDELVGLIESLRSSKSRPDALKNLIGKGFNLNQIAELSNIPYSDLELTRNLYKI
jgi:hypothetical protein